MVSSQERGMCKNCTRIVAEDNVSALPAGLAGHFSCFSDGAGDQGFPPGGYKCLLFFIIGCLINKSGVDGAWALVVDGFSIKSLEHRVTGGQRFPVTVLEAQGAAGGMSMQLTHKPRHSHSQDSSVPPPTWSRVTCRLGCTMAMMFPLVSLG